MIIVVKTLNILTKSQQEENALIELISKIENTALKQQYINKLKFLWTDNKPQKDKPVINLTTTLNRFRKDKQKEVTLQDIKQEINLIKKEIKNLKIKDKTSEEEITILKINQKILRIWKWIIRRICIQQY